MVVDASGGGPSPVRPRVLVLGGTGFLGSRVAAAVAAEGADTIVLARRAADYVHDDRRIGGISADLSELTVDQLRDLIDDLHPDVVVNATGEVWGTDVERMIHFNITLVHRLLAAVAELPTRTRFVQLGTVHEYAPVLDGKPTDEQVETVPRTLYGRTKLGGSQAVLAATASGRVDGVVLRISNVSGPGSPSASLLGQVAHTLMGGVREQRRPVLTLTPMRARRDFVDVRDVASAVAAAARSQVAGALNIGSGAAVEVRSVVDLLIRQSGQDAVIVERGEPSNGRAGGSDWIEVAISAARGRLGWRPQYSLDRSVRDLWAERVRKIPSAGSPVEPATPVRRVVRANS